MSNTEPISPPRLPPRKRANQANDAVLDTPPPLPSREGRQTHSYTSPVQSAAIDVSDPLASLGAVVNTQPISVGTTEDKPPPVPSRAGRRSVSPSPAPSTAPVILDEIEDTSATFVPPPLPPRAPPPIAIAEPPTPRVEVTPATPPYPLSPATANSSSFGQMGEEIRGTSAPVTAYPTRNPTVTPATSVSLPEKLKEAVADVLPELPDTSKIPPMEQVVSKLNVPPIEAVVLGALLLNLFLGRLSIFWVLLVGGAYAAYKQADTQSRASTSRIEADLYTRPGEGKEAVQWVNHALYALFPLISTDVLAPFIDLLEDALIDQVPPIVTSVRLTSAALGAQPMLLNSLRPMSDAEWFASLAPAKTKSHEAPQSPPGVEMQSPSKRTHQGTPSGAPKFSRSASSASNMSALDPEEVEQEANRRRKRDRILQKVSRRQQNLSGRSSRSAGHGNLTSSQHHDSPIDETGKSPSGHGAEEADEDDPNAGQYVNYQIGFEYKRTETTKKKGWGLHVLAYFGWGVKGVGKSEIPVYIDVLGVKGIINVRLLLSATPPFVRTATISFPSLPEFDISATPLRQGAFNAMELPGMKSYVQKSIAQVAKTFVRPKSYTIDVDRLLLGRESALRTHTVGVLRIIIHSASDLPKTDTVGSCDPYVMICMTKFRKPVFSTRTIIDTQSPSWEEEAYILVSADAIETGERLRLRLLDSDRFSADDSMGVVEVDIPDLVEQAEFFTADQPPIRRVDQLTPERSGMRTSGQLEWSVRFCPLWAMPREELEKRVEEKMQARPGEPTEDDMVLPTWLKWINNYMDVPNWAEERAKRREETLAWFTGAREREELEASAAPHDELRSGILQFHIHQCADLEADSSDGTYSSSMNHRLSAAGGKPALADITDRTPAENPEPPSAYCEVHLNDRFVYRTRTKQVTPLPYFNAVSERFIRDWRLAKIVFVIKDERDREHDPILGMVTLYLKDVLSEHSHFTRWFPLSGGLGWGHVRISLLFKPIDITLPPRVSGYEVATLEVKSLTATDLSSISDRNVSVAIETDCDRYTLETAGDEDGHKSTEVHSPGQVSSRASFDLAGDGAQVEWAIDRPIKLAVEYRHSCSVVISFITKSKIVKKKKVLGLATIKLDDCPDGESSERTVPIFDTTEVKDAVMGTAAWTDHDTQSPAAPSTPTRRLSSSSSRSRLSGGPARIIGYVTLSLVLHPGISRAHSTLCKKDLRFAKVYEAWEAYRDVVTRRAKTRDNKLVWTESMVDGEVAGMGSHGGAELEDSDSSGDEDDTSTGAELRRTISERDLYDAAEKEDGLSERRAHSKALHKKHKGIFQLKIVRTGAFVKDKLEAKLRSSGSQRRRGADLDVEHEGQSSL